MKKTDGLSSAENLRKKAEELWQKNMLKKGANLSSTDALKLIHELEVHQIELELQNEELQQARSTAHESAEKYRELYDSAPAGYFTLSKQGEIIELNLLAAQILGKEPSHFNKSSFNFYVSEESKPVFSQFLSIVFISGKIEACNVVIQNQSRPLQIHLTGIASDNNENAFVTATDITALSVAEKAIIENPQKLSSILENTNASIWSVDSNYRLIFGNTNFQNEFKLGFGKEPGIGELVLPDTLPAIQQEEWKAYYNRALKGESFSFRRERKYSKNPKWSEYHFGPVANDYAENFAVTVVAHDITEQVLMEKALRDSEELHRITMQNIIDPVFITNDSGIFTYICSNVRHALGYSIKEIEKMDNISAFIGDNLFDINELYLKKRLTNIEHKIADKSGKIHYFLITISQISIQGGTILYVFHDITERKWVLDELQKSEEKYRLLFEHMTDGFQLNEVIVDENNIPVDFRFLDGNPKMKEFTGYSIDEVRGKTIKEVIPDADIEMIQRYGNVALTGEPLTIEYFSKTFKRYFRVNSYSTVKGLFATVFEDISDRKMAEQAIRLSEEKYRLLAENATDMITQLDKNGTYLYVSPSSKTIFGYEPWEVIGKTFHEFVHPDDLDQLLSTSSQQIKNDNKFRAEYRRLKKDGNFIWVEIISNIKRNAETGETIKITSVIREIVDRKKAEQELLENQRRLESLVEILQFHSGSTQELLDFTLEKAIKLTNSKLGYIYFYDEIGEKFTLFSWSEGVMKECAIKDPKTVYDLRETGIWGEAVRQKKPIVINDFEAVNPLKKGYPKGHAKLFKFLTLPVISANKIVAVIGVANKEEDYHDADILHLTLLMGNAWKAYEKINMEDLVKKQNIELTKLNADKDRFISILAHDLKEPFTSILGLSDLLTRNIHKYNNDKIIEMVGYQKKAAKNTYNLLLDLLMWTRSQSGNLPFEPEEVPLYKIFNEVLEVLIPNAEAKNITINHFGTENLSVFADTNMLKTILRNLIANAIKFTHNGGHVDVIAKIINSHVEITVSDNGVGIAPEVLSKLFDITQKVSTKGTDNEGGTGLGLLLCKDFVEKHKGTISVQSEEGKGSRFSFTIPDSRTSL